jgi:hypothetical protein
MTCAKVHLLLLPPPPPASQIHTPILQFQHDSQPPNTPSSLSTSLPGVFFSPSSPTCKKFEASGDSGNISGDEDLGLEGRRRVGKFGSRVWRRRGAVRGAGKI